MVAGERCLCGSCFTFWGCLGSRVDRVIDCKEVVSDVLDMWINSKLLRKTGVLLELGYALSKLEDGERRHYRPRRVRQCA